MRQLLAVSVLGAALAVTASAAFASDHDSSRDTQAPAVAVRPVVASPAMGDQSGDIYAQPVLHEHGN